MVWFVGSRIRRVTPTSRIEERREQLQKDYIEFKAFSKSPVLELFLELKNYIHSEKFKAQRKEIESLKYKGSAEWIKEKTFRKLQKSFKLRTYFKVKNSPELDSFTRVKNSPELILFQELEREVKASGFKKREQSEKWKQYQSMRKSTPIREFLKFQKSRQYRLFCMVDDSQELKDFHELESYLNSDEFIKNKKFLNDKRRFEQTADYQKLLEFKKLEDSEDIKKYFLLKKSDPFKELKSWELTFDEDFDSLQLNREKWITSYYWGDVFLNDSYALPNEYHLFTNGENITLKDSIAILETRHENVTGKVWDSSVGFIPKNFEYTSGLLSTGKSFRQLYGLFEAKIRIGNPKAVNHNFWMLSDKMLPHIDVMKTKSNDRVEVGNWWGSSSKPLSDISKIKGLDLSGDFFIYSLEWSSEKLIWRINDQIIKVQKKGVPQEPMYIILSSGLTAPANGSLPTQMEIDWVRCYKEI